jgi:hypothetical protein
MDSRIRREDDLGGQHLEEATQTTLECDFAWGGAFMGFPATELGQQLHFSPLESHPQAEEKASRDPAQGHLGVDAPQIK